MSAVGTAGSPAPGIRRGARPAAPRPRLTVVAPLRRPAPRAPFVALVGALLVTGLGALLLLHTAIAEDSFRLHDLTARSTALADREQELEQEVAAAADPRRLASRARALGMVRSENPAFIRISDGRILGKPKAGVAPPVKAPPRPSPSPSAATAGGAGAAATPAAKPRRGTGPAAKPRGGASPAAAATVRPRR